jgi:hypothetical protein
MVSYIAKPTEHSSRALISLPFCLAHCSLLTSQYITDKIIKCEKKKLYAAFVDFRMAFDLSLVYIN